MHSYGTRGVTELADHSFHMIDNVIIRLYELVETDTNIISQSAMLQFLRLAFLCKTRENSLHTNCGLALTGPRWFS